MNAIMKHDMEKKDYIEPKMAIAELEGDFVLYGVGGSNGDKGGDLAKERFQDLEDLADEYEIEDIWK